MKKVGKLKSFETEKFWRVVDNRFCVTKWSGKKSLEKKGRLHIRSSDVGEASGCDRHCIEARILSMEIRSCMK